MLRTHLKLKLKLTFKYILTYLLSKNNKRCAFVGTKIIKSHQHKQQHKNQNFKCSYSLFANHYFCVDFLSGVRHIGDWNRPKFMHESKYT